jgi:Contact-dependent growth inhibition CdiA C-terminal domain
MLVLSQMTAKINGKIEKEIGAVIEPHEALAADALALNGFDVMFLRPLNTYKTKTPDILMRGLEWELKSPTSSEKTTIPNIIHKATKQSSHLVVDTFRTNLSDIVVIAQLKACILKHRSIKKLIVITKSREIIELKGKL